MRHTTFEIDDANAIVGTLNTYSDVVSVTGRGIVEYGIVKADVNPTNIGYYGIEIDGNSYDFNTDFPFEKAFGIFASSNRIQFSRHIVFETSFKIKAYYTTAASTTHKYLVQILKDT
jgi:hypothetical protein